MKKLRTGRSLNRSKAGNVIVFLMLFISGSFMALPIVYAVIHSFKPIEEIFIFPPRFFVINPTIENYTMLIQLTENLWVPFSRYVFNSLFVTFTGTAGHVLVASMAAFPLAKYKFPGSKFLFSIIVLSLLFTPQVTYIPQYVILAQLNMINTYGALILPAFAMTLGLFLMRQNMVLVPDSSIEAAKIDGANEFKLFWSIIVPLVKPAWLTLTIFSFQSMWNNRGTAFIYDEAIKVLPTVMSQIILGGIARVGVGTAASVFLMIPPITIFLLAQGSIIETMSHSGVKG